LPTEILIECMKKILLASLLYTLIGGGIFAKNTKPNVILFLVDDMGLMDTSVPMLADKEARPRSIPQRILPHAQTWSVWPSRV
jgi:hypothetical protein